MAKPSKRSIAATVLDRYGRTFADELKIPVRQNTPSPLFRLLCYALLSSTRISHALALDATRALADSGWITPQKMADATWRQRVTVLNRSGYARYDESTSTMLGKTSGYLIERYGGDLRKLREEAERDVGKERRLLQEFKGIGDVGADIFFREVQIAWDEVFPFADRRALEAASRLGLGKDVDGLRRAVDGRQQFVRLMAGLVRVRLEDGFEEVREAA